MAFAFVKEIDQQTATDVNNVLTLTNTGSAIPAGSLVYVRGSDRGQTLTSVTDSRFNSYTPHDTPSFATDGGLRASRAYSVIATQIEIGDTFTVTFSGNGARSAMGSVFSGNGITLDQTNDGPDKNFTVDSDAGSITTSVACLMLATYGYDTADTITSLPTGYTENTGITNGSSRGIRGVYKIQTVAGAEALAKTGMWTGSADSKGMLDSFRESGGAVVSVPLIVLRIPNRMVGPMALRNLYRTATPTVPTADASQLPITIGAPPRPLKLPNPYVGPMALRQVTKLPPPPLPTIGVTDSVGFATTGTSAPSFTVTDTASPTVVLPFRIANRNVGPMALRQAFRQPGFQSVNTAGGVTQTFGFNTTGSSAPAFTLAGMTDTFVVATTGHSAPVFTLAGMTDVFVLATTGKSTPAFVLAGMTDVFVVSATGTSTPAFAVVSIPAGGSTDVFAFAATGVSTPRFGLIFFSLNREGDRVSREAGLGLGSMYEYANYSQATSAAAAEHSRVNAGVGLGAGSHIDFTNAAAKTDEATTEGNRVKDLAGIGGGSQANL